MSNSTKNDLAAAKPRTGASIPSPKKSLDELVEVLNKDDLRHVVGGLRPKGKPWVSK